MHKRNWSNWLSCLLLICATGVACAAPAKPDPAAILRAKYASLAEQLRQNQFKRPLVLESAETPNHLKGDIYAIVDYPFGAVSTGLDNPDHWCDVLLLHINTKYCHAMTGQGGTTLRVNIGRKTPEKLSIVPRVELDYSVAAATPEYFEIVLYAKDGPLGTSDYRILLEAVALPNSKTFLHLTYSYAMNFTGRVAMQTYLVTIGRDKVGFTVIGKQADGQPEYIGGVRGLVERNTMRYYLAIDTFLGAARAAPAARFEKCLQAWFTAVERYPRQLHEIDRDAYLEMKRAEYLRQQTVY
ncbi:hypothetical protein SKTS_20990 [Sulfurimicrobium lacus]|uniref:Uncharacterized protein n=1 Tax=Sulfurimicrobium lacus TaxID=2715678 RepID=A0A6F8VBJ8_9PROT|nr:hypothetical protein [Sulfurimicrobium lacus]BCB27213.1 hypothetical protein SKTS_20990 [Sulfurimicrobium lacus]